MASFSKLKMRTALILIVLIPLLGLLYFSVNLTLEKSAVAREMGKLEMLVGLSVKIGNIVHELQKERGMTAGFLGSKGVKFAGELPAQRNEADKKIGTLKQAIAAFEADQLDHSIKDLLDIALREIDELGTTRNAVSAQSITSEDAIGYYSRTIGRLLDITNQASTLSSNSQISRLGSSYAVLLMDKEDTGQERAALTGVFTADKFTPASLARYFSNRVSQDVHKSIFDTYALDEHKQFYKNKISGQAIDEVATIEKTAIEKMNEKSLGIDSANWFKVITEKIDLLKEVEDKLANDLLESTRLLKGKAESMMTFYILLSAGVLAITLVFAMYMIRRLLRQIGGEPDYAADVLRRVAEGDLTVQVQIHSGDTTSLLASLKGMVNKLSELVGEVRSSTDTINIASREIAQGNTDLSQRTEEQASSLEETASSMEELTSTVKQNAENARQANQLATNASDIAVKGGQAVGEVVQTMASISDSSKKIVDIISVIDSIAFQTNILALNAAVEAARAGEQGRGFAVVAGEVRNLAQRSAAAAKEIKALIGDSVDKVMVGSKQVEQAGATMSEIVTAVKRVTDIMSEIAAASNEQSAGIEQINQAITQMDDVTQQNAALVEEAAAASESLEEEAQRQTQSVSVFKLNESATQPQAGRAPAARPAAPPTARLAAKHNPIIIKHELAAEHGSGTRHEPAAMFKQATRTRRPDAHPKTLPKHKGNGEADWAEF